MLTHLNSPSLFVKRAKLPNLRHFFGRQRYSSFFIVAHLFWLVQRDILKICFCIFSLSFKTQQNKTKEGKLNNTDAIPFFGAVIERVFFFFVGSATQLYKKSSMDLGERQTNLLFLSLAQIPYVTSGNTFLVSVFLFHRVKGLEAMISKVHFSQLN